MTKVYISEDLGLLKKQHEKEPEAEYWLLNGEDDVVYPDWINCDEDTFTEPLREYAKLPQVMTKIFEKHPVKEIIGSVNVPVLDENEQPVLNEDGTVKVTVDEGVVMTEMTFEYEVLTHDKELYVMEYYVCDENCIQEQE